VSAALLPSRVCLQLEEARAQAAEDEEEAEEALSLALELEAAQREAAGARALLLDERRRIQDLESARAVAAKEVADLTAEGRRLALEVEAVKLAQAEEQVG
jgi:hypothetical protein